MGQDLISRHAALALPVYDGDGDPSGQFDHQIFVKLADLRALPSVPAPSQWQPIETAPKDGTRILAYWPPVLGDVDNGGWVTTWWGTSAGGASSWESPWEYADMRNGPTHWLLHPKTPEAV